MKEKNKFIILIFFEILFFGSLFIVLPSLFIREKSGVSKTQSQNILPLDTKNNYVQEFVTDRDNLQSISILLKNPQLFNQSQINIDLLDKNRNILRSLKTSGVSVGDPSWIDFKFSIVSSKAGDKFFIKITTDNTKMDSLYVYGNEKDKSINYKTTYTSKNLKESFTNNLKEQSQKFNKINKIYLTIYLLLIIGLNIAIFKNINQ